MNCDIVLLVWNQYELTKKCIDSIFENTLVRTRLIIVDNGSETGVQKYLETVQDTELVNVLLLRNEKNEGFARGMNRGMKASSAPYVCLLNNDVVVAPGWLTEMIRVGEMHKKIGLINPHSNNFGVYPAPGEDIYDVAARRSKDRGTYVINGACVGFCMLIKREVIDQIGYLDEERYSLFFEDTDYSRSAVERGFQCVLAKGAYVFHREHSSVNEIGEEKEKLFKENQERFFKKWGRPLRIINVIFNRDIQGKSFGNMLKNNAWLGTKGSFIHIFFRHGRLLQGSDIFRMHNMVEHGNIRLFNSPGPGLSCRAATKILTKKKKYDLIFTDSPLFAKWIKTVRFLHHADMYVNPDGEEMKRLWQHKSRYQ
ncbi:MAG: glycosyltransferase family 2 protein [Candidatus Omnitrophica bacterium]|nr:glycosyltransferase family 2 protein [Candidatus Omnitrophota bacterium]